jgi:hypothetical protein
LFKLRLNSGADIQKTTLALKYFTKFPAVFAILAACAGEEEVMNDGGMGYFRLQKGLFHIYTVHETHYSAATDPQVFNYELLTEVVDSFSSENQYTYVIHRSRRGGETDPWEPLDTWSARKDKHAVVVAEGNISFVKVKFPVWPENRWDGNALNTMGHDEYVFADIHQPMQVDGMTFEKTPDCGGRAK